MRNFWLLAVTAAVSISIIASGAQAELLVIESTAPGIVKDAGFPDTAIFDVPAGKKIRLLKKPQNSTHEIVGPYRGALDAYQPHCGWWSRLIGKCSKEQASDSSAPDAAPVVGATRSLNAPTDSGASDAAPVMGATRSLGGPKRDAP